MQGRKGGERVWTRLQGKELRGFGQRRIRWGYRGFDLTKVSVRAQPASEGASTCQDARLKALKNRGAERRVWLVRRLVSFLLFLFCICLCFWYYITFLKDPSFISLCCYLSLSVRVVECVYRCLRIFVYCAYLHVMFSTACFNIKKPTSLRPFILSTLLSFVYNFFFLFDSFFSFAFLTFFFSNFIFSFLMIYSSEPVNF